MEQIMDLLKCGFDCYHEVLKNKKTIYGMGCVHMNNNYFMGYRVNYNIRHFFPNTIVFENEKITVSMINDALDYILSIISTRFPPAKSYKRAKMIFEAMKKILANRQVGPMRKEDLKLAVDVLEEIKIYQQNRKKKNRVMPCMRNYILEITT